MHDQLAPKPNVSLITAWLVFIKERFNPIEHLPVIFFLTLGNGAIASSISGASMSIELFIVVFAICLSFFFRLRCFDEIKDYQTDLIVNPNRPLVRGLLSVRHVKQVILLLIGFELTVAYFVNMNAFFMLVAAVVYSTIMYKEFFAGKYLVPHLTTYAILHTFVSVLVSCTVFTFVSGSPFTHFGWSPLALGFANWAIFNLFEFARKTYAKSEERTGVPSYSTIFGINGAVLLCFSQIFAAILMIMSLPYRENTAAVTLYLHLFIAAIPALSGLYFLIIHTKMSATIFRHACSGYLVLFFALLSYQGLS